MSKITFKPYPFAYFQGRIVPIEEAKISIMTNALHYGTGIFGGIKTAKTNNGPAIFRLDDHVQRLQNSVATLGFNFNFDSAKIKQDILKLAYKNKVGDTAYIRPLIYRSDTLISPDIAGDYDIAIYILNMPHYFDPNKGLRVMVSSWQRNSDNSIPPRTKATGGYINSALAIHEAHGKGFDSAVMLDKNGNVSEGAVMNLFLAKDGRLITPTLDSDILEGITRRTVIELATMLNIPVSEQKVDKEELLGADEVFFTGTAANITWCSTVDDVEISHACGPISESLSQALANLPQTQPALFTPINP